MIWIFSIVAIFTVSIGCAAQGAVKIQNGFQHLDFKVELNKDTYVVGEPVIVSFKLTNVSGSPQSTYEPAFLQESRIRVKSEGKVREYAPLSPGGKPIRFPGELGHGGAFEKDEIIASPHVLEMFSDTGKYRIQFLLRDPSGEIELESNTLELTFEPPTGIDKAALAFMRKHWDYFGLSSWTENNHKGFSLLQRFVLEYGPSSYGDLAISALGSLYATKGELESAKFEFSKLERSDKVFFVRHARKSLSDIENRNRTRDDP